MRVHDRLPFCLWTISICLSNYVLSLLSLLTVSQIVTTSDCFLCLPTCWTLPTSFSQQIHRYFPCDLIDSAGAQFWHENSTCSLLQHLVPVAHTLHFFLPPSSLTSTNKQQQMLGRERKCKDVK